MSTLITLTSDNNQEQKCYFKRMSISLSGWNLSVFSFLSLLPLISNMDILLL